MYVTTAKPGQMHIFDLSAGPGKPRLLKSIPAAEGAHHIAFTLDGRYAYVQNALLNLPGMSDGSITVDRSDDRNSDRQRRYAEECGLQPEQHGAAAAVERSRRPLNLMRAAELMRGARPSPVGPLRNLGEPTLRRHELVGWSRR